MVWCRGGWVAGSVLISIDRWNQLLLIENAEKSEKKM